MNFPEIHNLVEQEISWSSLFRKMLAEFTPEERERMVLFREVQRFFDVRVETLSLIGGWNYWPDGTCDDETLNAKLGENSHF